MDKETRNSIATGSASATGVSDSANVAASEGVADAGKGGWPAIKAWVKGKPFGSWPLILGLLMVALAWSLPRFQALGIDADAGDRILLTALIGLAIAAAAWQFETGKAVVRMQTDLGELKKDLIAAGARGLETLEIAKRALEYARQGSDSQHNQVSTWVLKIGTPFVSMYGQLRGDVRRALAQDGSETLYFDKERLQNHLRRFLANKGQSSIIYVIAQPEGEIAKETLAHLALIRAIKQLALDQAVEIDLSKARFVFDPSPKNPMSIIIGHPENLEQETMLFYADVSGATNLNANLLDQAVHRTWEPKSVAACYAMLDQALKRSKVITYEGAEALFGSYVPGYEIGMGIPTYRPTVAKHEPVINGDHMAW